MALLKTRKNKRVAVVEEKRQQDLRKLFRALLSASNDSVSFEDHVVPFIEHNIWPALSIGVSVELAGAGPSDVVKRELRELGFIVKAGEGRVEVRAKENCRYLACDIERCVGFARDLRESLLFMSELFIAMHYYNFRPKAKNDVFKAPVFDFKQSGDSARASFVLPRLLLDDFAGSKSGECLSNIRIEGNVCTATFKPFTIAFTEGEKHTPKPDDWQGAFCGSVLWHIVNSSKPAMLLDYKVLHMSEGSIVTEFAKELAAWKVEPCAWCGRPVYLYGENQPFCHGSATNRGARSSSCYAQYNRAAKQMLKNGSSTEDVSNSFWLINKSTIAKWAK